MIIWHNLKTLFSSEKVNYYVPKYSAEILHTVSKKLSHSPRFKFKELGILRIEKIRAHFSSEKVVYYWNIQSKDCILSLRNWVIHPVWYRVLQKLRGQDEVGRWYKNGILLPKLFRRTVRKNCSSDWEKIVKFKAEGPEFAKILRSLEQFIQTV